MKRVVIQIQKFLNKKLKEAKAKGVIIGLSGGIDSSVTSALAVQALGKDRVLGIIMPCYSNAQDQKDAKLHVEQFEIPYKVIKLTKSYTKLLNTLTSANAPKMAKANLKARLRMCVLYFYANVYNYLVLGTCNKSEILIGYETKFGDGACDINPVGDLYKRDIRKLAKYLEIDERIIVKPPSAGLWADQTDEGELGILYDDLDNILEKFDHYLPPFKELNKQEKKVAKLIINSTHKRNLAPICKIK